MPQNLRHARRLAKSPPRRAPNPRAPNPRAPNPLPARPRSAPRRQDRNVARIIAGVSSSHVPAIGAAIDLKKTDEPYWNRLFSRFEKSKEWVANANPDMLIALD